jgi:hypothetical protein
MNNNIALFIKRSEEYQGEQFIRDVFLNNKIGKVSSIKFISKNDSYGKSYNGVIVTFEQWYMNSRVENLIQEMATSSDKTSKFYFNQHRYWIVSIHKQTVTECEEKTTIDTLLPDKEKIKQLEALVQSLSVQICYLKTQEEKSACTIMSYEKENTYARLINSDLRSQVEMKELEQEWIKNKFEKKIESIQKENYFLDSKLVESENEINLLKEELYEERSINEYLEEENNKQRIG